MSAFERADILTASGHYFDLLNPEQAVFGIHDIAAGLSKICRFNGQCRAFYSVAQHSVLVSSILEPAYALPGLLHDAAEAFVGDVTRPLKRLLPDYQRIEARVEAAVFERFGLGAMPAQVRRADLIALATEQRDLMPAHNDTWACLHGIEPLGRRIVPWPPEIAYETFLTCFQQLTAGQSVETAS